MVRSFVVTTSTLRLRRCDCDAATFNTANVATNQRTNASRHNFRGVVRSTPISTATIRCCCCCRMYVCMACMEMPRRAWKAETCGVKHDARLCYVDGGVVARTIDSNRRGDVATMTGSSSCARTATRAWIHDRCKTLGMWASETSVLCLCLWGNNKNCLGRPGGLSGIFYRGLLDILCVRGATC